MSTFHDTVRVEEGDFGEEVIAFRHDWASRHELGPLITTALVERTDVPFEQITSELQRSVDLDRLDGLFSPWLGDTTRNGGTLMLDLPSFEIVIHSDGWVEITHPPTE